MAKDKDKLIPLQQEEHMQPKISDYEPRPVKTINVQADIDEKLHAAVRKKLKDKNWTLKGLIESSFKAYLGIKPDKKNET